MKFFSAAIVIGSLFATASASNCGANCSPALRDEASLQSCLSTEFSAKKPLSNGVPTLTFPTDGTYYDAARNAWKGSNYPAAVVYARDESDVKGALKCAVDSGYKVSVRAHGHSYQGLSVMSGYVVIDLHLTCEASKLAVDKSKKGEHILPGSRYIATVKMPAGCTNSAMYAALADHFDESEKAVAVLGLFPSVGVSGCTLGGCSGELTPYAGYAIDVLESIEMVTYDGKTVVASKNENQDLFWATQGGGGGNGVVTSYTYKVIENPSDVVTRLHIYLDLTDESVKRTFLEKLQVFLYDADVHITSRFGGGGMMGILGNYLELTYLGGWRMAITHLTEAGLIGNGIPFMDDQPSHFIDQFEVQCQGQACTDKFDLSPTGMHIWQSDSFSKMWAYLSSASLNDSVQIGNSGYVCDDLGIDDQTYCADVGTLTVGQPIRMLNPPISKIGDPDHKDYALTVINALLTKARDPEAFMNSVGFSLQYMKNFNLSQSSPEVMNTKITPVTGLLIPRLQTETFVELASFFLMITHFQHGAPLRVAKDATAFPWRNSAIMTPSGYTPENFDKFVDILSSENPAFIQGYYNTMGPLGTNDWQRLYFGDNYPRLTSIRKVWDPKDVFGKPLSVELPAATCDNNDMSRKADQMLQETAELQISKERGLKTPMIRS